MMQQPVQECGGEGAVVVEDFRPVFVGTVRGDDDGAALVACADDLEEKIGAVFVDGKVAQFIDDQDRRLQILVQGVFEAAGGLRGGKRVDDVDGGAKCPRKNKVAVLGLIQTDGA